MGMFDELRCYYELNVDGAHDERTYQTKSLECALYNYEIRADGTLWREHFDTVDRSNPNATGLGRFAGMLARVNPRWEPETYTGEVRFYDGDLTFSAYFYNGHLEQIHQLGEDDA